MRFGVSERDPLPPPHPPQTWALRRFPPLRGPAWAGLLPILSIGVVISVGLSAVVLAIPTGPSAGSPRGAHGAAPPGPATKSGAGRPPPPAARMGIHPLVSSTPAKWARFCGTASGVGSVCTPQPLKVQGAGIAYDAADGYVLEFDGGAGATGALKNATWKWKGGAWTQLATGLTPAARSNFTMVYDTADGYVLLFGGYIGSGTSNASTWKFTAGGWTKLFTFTAGLLARSGACGVYVPLVNGHGGYVLVFGGKTTGTTAGTYLQDTWKFSGGTWTNITASVGTAPARRDGAVCAYDAADNYVVMFGGMTSAGGFLNDTWKFDPAGGTTGTWTNLLANGASGQPSPRFFGGASYVTTAGLVALVAGARGTINAPAPLPFDTWSFLTGAWANTTTSWTGPAPSTGVYSPSMADVPGWQYAIYFGGMGSGPFNWTHALGNPLTTLGSASNLGELAVNTPVTLWTNVTGGTGVYTTTWSNLPSGCVTANTTTLTCIPSSAGVYRPNATVSDSASEVVSPRSIRVVVDASVTATGVITPGKFLYSPNPTFFGGNVWANNSAFPGVAALINATPIRFLHFYGQFDKTNFSAGYQGVTYTANGVAQNFVQYNMSQYVALCRVTACTAFPTVLAQTNDSGEAVAALQQWESRWGLKATYLTVGVEVNNWNHFNIAFPSWRSTDNTAPTGFQYQYELGHVLPYLRSVDPNFKTVVQLSAGNIFNASIISIAQNVSKYLCSSVAAIGIDYYPQQGNNFNNPNLAAFFSNVSSLPSRVGQITTGVAQGNAACTTIQPWITENNAANGNSAWVPYMSGFPDVPYVAAEIIQSLTSKAGQYNTWSLVENWSYGGGGVNGAGFSMLNVTNSISQKPTYGLYSGLLPSFPIGSISWANLSTSMNGVFSVSGTSATGSRAYLISNTNTTTTLRLNATNLAGNRSISAFSDDPTNGVVRQEYAGPAALRSISIPPLSVLVLVAAPAPAAASGPASGGVFATASDPTMLYVEIFLLAAATSLLLAMAVWGGESRRRRG